MSSIEINYPSIQIKPFEQFQNSILNICTDTINNYKGLLEILPLNIKDLKKYQNRLDHGKKKTKGITLILKELAMNVNKKWLNNKQLINAIFSIENLFRKFFSNEKFQNDYIYNFVMLEEMDFNFITNDMKINIITSVLKNITDIRNCFLHGKSKERQLSFFSNSESMHSICSCEDIINNISELQNLPDKEELLLKKKSLEIHHTYNEYKKMMEIVKFQYFYVNNFLINIYLFSKKENYKEIHNLFISKREEYEYIINSSIFLHVCEIFDVDLIEKYLKYTNISLNHFYSNRNMFPLEYIFTSIRNKTLLEKILNHPAYDINSKDGYGRSIIHKLFNADMSSPITQLVLNRPFIDFNAQDSYGETILMQSIESDNIELTRFLLKQPMIIVNLTNVFGETALALAIEYQRIEAIEELLNFRNININLRDNNGVSHLMKAIKFSIPKEIIKKIIDFPNIDLSAKDKKGRNLLFYIINHSCTGIITYLISKGVELNVNKNFNTKESPINMAIKYADKEILNEILTLPTLDINKIDDRGRTPLMVAIENEDEESVKLLLKRPDLIVNKNDRYKRIPLNYAAEHNLLSIVEALVHHKDILINNRDSEGRTSLICASLNDNANVINLLLENNADINIQDNYNYTAIMYTIEHNFYKSFNILLNRNDINLNVINDSQQNLLQLAVTTDSIDMVKKIINIETIDINHTDKYHKSALLLAVESKYSNDLADQLLSRPDIDINIKDIHNNTALSLSIELNKPSLTKKILQFINNKRTNS